MAWYQVKDIGDWIIGVLQAVAWPGALLIAIWTFKQPLVKIVNRIAKIKFGDTEITISAELDRIEDKAGAIKVPPAEARMEIKEEPDQVRVEGAVAAEAEEFEGLAEIAKSNPELAILGAWNDLEKEFRAAATRAGYAAKATQPIHVLSKEMRDLRLISADIYGVADNMRRVRNRVAHHDSVTETTTEDAYRYIEIARDLLRSLRSIGD